MKAFKLFGVLVLLSLSAQHRAQAQGRAASADERTIIISCKRATLDVWIQEPGREQPFEGRFAGMSQDKIYFCVDGSLQIRSLTRDSVVLFKASSLGTNRSQPLQPSGIATTITQQLSHDTLSGTVRVQFILYDNGDSSYPRVVSSDNPLLNTTAIDAARQFKLAPAGKGGKPAGELIEIIFTFVAKKTADGVGGAVAEMPSPIYPVKLDKVPREKPVSLRWKSVPGAVTYLLKVEYYDIDGKWKREWTKRIPAHTQSFLLTYLGLVHVKWTVEAELENGARVESWWAFFDYETK